MVHIGVNWRKRTQRAAWALSAVALPLVLLGGSVAYAQSIMRTPNLNLGSRVPTINQNVRVNPAIGARVNPGAAGRLNAVRVNRPMIANRPNNVGDRPATIARIPKGGAISRVGVGTLYPRYSPNLYPVCEYANRGPDGECFDRAVTVVSTGGGGNGPAAQNGNTSSPSNASPQAAIDLRTVPNELVAEIDGALSPADADELARRHGLERIASQEFRLIGSTIGLFRIVDQRPVDIVRREFAADGSVKSVQLNFRYLLQDQKDQKRTVTEGDAAQYAVAQLRLPPAHKLVRGMNVTIAVIDSGVDVKHPELVNSVADSFDALGSKEGPHVHGTGIAGAIAAHGRLMGSAPEARLLAIRAFGGGANGAGSTSYVILKSLDYATEHGAQIINMSFAGPKDPLIERGVAATASRGILMVAAVGNGGAKSPPLYPAANPNVIAVSGTDAQEKLFAASNRGAHISVAAPGADIFLPAPDEKYQITSGTSFSAAYVSGVAALMLERNPALKPNDLRRILEKTARDLGAPGRDDQFGAGEADAYAAVTAATAAPAVPLAAVSGNPASPKAPAPDNASVSRAMNDAAPAMASDKSAANGVNRPTAQ
ncbi:MAG: S8 family serine peptidase [Rhizobiales bacterium]|nr:S8 family serine peptidase [Hyphomicrobiales bacterium]